MMKHGACNCGAVSFEIMADLGGVIVCHCSICRRCGSPVPAANDESRMFVPAGSLTDGTENLTVTDHIWVGSKAPWDEIGDSGRCHLEAFENSNNRS